MRRFKTINALIIVVLASALMIVRTQPAHAASTPHLDDNRGAASIAVPTITALLSTLTGLPTGVIPLVFTPRVIPHPSIFNVYWGDNWDHRNSPDFSMANIDGFTRDLAHSNYFDPASQYGVGNATFAGSHNGSFCGSPGSGESFTSILGWITCEAQTPNTGVPYPDTDQGNTIYNVWLPHNTLPAEAGGNCAKFSAYHMMSAALTIEFVLEVIPVPVIQQYAYTILPVDCATQQAANDPSHFPTQFDALTEMASHEFIEASTDPNFGIGWIDDSTFDFGAVDNIAHAGEAGDICELSEGAASTDPVRLDDGVMVAPYWSNDAGACVPQTHTVRLGQTGIPFSAPHQVNLTGAAVGDPGLVTLPRTLKVVDGGHIAWSFPSPVADPTPGIRYVTSDPGSAGAVTITGDVTDVASYATQDFLAVGASPAAAQAIDTTLTPSAWEPDGITVNLSTDSLIPSGIDRYLFTSWSGGVADSSSPTTTVVMNGPQTVIANYAFQHLLTVNTSGLPSPNMTHITLTGTTLGTANDVNPLSVWVNDGTPLATLSADGDVNGAGGVQSFFQSFTPAPPTTLTARFATTAGYLTMDQIIGIALGNGGISGPTARGVGGALTTKFSNVQTEMAAAKYAPALGDITGFITQVQAQCCSPSAGKAIAPATATTLQLDAWQTYHLALCLGTSQLSASQESNDYAVYKAAVTRLGGTVLPPC